VAGGRLGKTPEKRAEAGNVIVEMALILPILLLVVAGIIDLGTLYWEKQILTNATGEGARMAARAGTDGKAGYSSSEIQQLVQDYLDRFHLKAPGGGNIVLSQGGNFNYQWNTGVTPVQLWVEINNIPVHMLLLPQIQPLFGQASGAATATLQAKTTVAAEWTAPPP
jgi:Flp pilus assembly protein TadG